jgi:serine/threonine protein kinase
MKPENILMGLKGKQSNQVHLIDFGLSKRFMHPKNGNHIEYRNDKHMIGTARYASTHSHLGEELSRRDDLEALSYIMLYMFLGKLPWQNVHTSNKQDKYMKIRDMK